MRTSVVAAWTWCLLLSHPPLLWRAWVCLLSDLWGRLLLCSPKAVHFWARHAHFAQLFLDWRGVPVSSHLGGPSLNSFQVLNGCLVLEVPKLDEVFSCEWLSPFTQCSLSLLHPLPVFLSMQDVFDLLCCQVTDTCFFLPGRKWPGRVPSSEP